MVRGETVSKAVVLLSGGLDSTTTLAQAIADGNEVVALSFRYGQRHSKELVSASNVAKFYNIRHVIVDMDLSMFRSALTMTDIDVPENRNEEEMGADIPITYVPARNIIMLSVPASANPWLPTRYTSAPTPSTTPATRTAVPRTSQSSRR